MLGYAKDLQADGAVVVLGHCGVTGGSCASNLIGSRIVCRICQRSTHQTARALGLPIVQLGRPIEREMDSPLSFAESKALLESVRSCLISVLRVLGRDLSRISILQHIKRLQFRTAASIFVASTELMKREKFDVVAVFNGRFGARKAPILAAVKENIPFNILELNLYQNPMIFRGHTPHDRTAIQRRMLANPADRQVAKRYFDQRRCRSFNKFANQHQEFTPPTNIALYRRRVAFFLSSQDECESLGPEWRSPFRDNASVIEAAAKAYPQNFFCVRFHPNQASILSNVTDDFRRLEVYQNIKIYWPKDQINSYRLVDWSDLVVTFASTISVEACWQGRAVVQLGPSFYDQLGFSETPTSVTDFLSLLSGDIHARSTESVTRFANYAVNDYDTIKYLEDPATQPRLAKSAKIGGLAVKPAKRFNKIAKSGLTAWISWRVQRNRAA